MSNEVDLRELALDRGGTAQPVQSRRHVLSRYVVPLLLVAGFLWLVAWAGRDVLFPPKAVTVQPVFATQSELRQEGAPLFNAAGWIEPRPTPVRVAALSPGVVEELLVVEDQPVRAGEPVAELVKDDARLARDRALADLELREAELAEAEANLRAAETRLKHPVHLEAALGEAEASLARVETQLKNLPFETRRAEADQRAARKSYEGKLAAQGVVAGVEIDIAKSRAESASTFVEELEGRAVSLAAERAALQKRRDALQTQLTLLAAEIKARDEADARVRGATARVNQARVVVAETELRLSRMTVKSPIEGRVFRLVAHPGAHIGSGMSYSHAHDGSTIVTLYRPDMLQVRVDVRFEDIPKVSLDQLVEIANPALSAPLNGKVLFVSSEADIQKNTLQVKVAIPDPPDLFKPEMLVDVTFLAPERPQQASDPSGQVRLYVLQQLVHEDDAGPFVWRADRSAAVARKTRVQIGPAASNGLVEVTAGLKISSRIIVNGTQGLRDGDRIRVTGEDGTLGTTAAEDDGRVR